MPPPATCYGFLLALVGETDRRRHVGARVAPGVLGEPDCSVVLRTVWRVKNQPLGSAGNMRPDYQQLLTNVQVAIWLDSQGEVAPGPALETRVQQALDPEQRRHVTRFGGLSLGESTHLVDDVALLAARQAQLRDQTFRLYLKRERGRLSLPVWVDHVGAAGSVFVAGDLVNADLAPPPIAAMPVIRPP